MLKIVRSMKELDFSALMEIYAESNAENAAEFWPEEPEGQRLLHAEQEFHQYLRECFFTTDGACYCVWLDGESWVSALRLEPYQDGLLIEALETDPERRRKGYAKALLRAVQESFPDRKLYSHLSKRNTASRRTHESCGFRKILDHAVYADGSVLSGSATYLYEVSR